MKNLPLKTAIFIFIIVIIGTGIFILAQNNNDFSALPSQTERKITQQNQLNPRGIGAKDALMNGGQLTNNPGNNESNEGGNNQQNPPEPETQTQPPASANEFVIVDTAQTSCYNNSTSITCPESGSFFGQDAQYVGNKPSYTDNGNGTVTDNRTGLMWIQSNGSKQDYYSAISSAKSFSFAGHNDWRVPTIKELYSLMDFRGIDPDAQGTNTEGLRPFINTSYFDFEYGDTSSGSRIIDSQWITSSIYKSKVMNGQECFFGVNFADGRIKCYPTRSQNNQGYYLRMVRSNENYGENNFRSSGDIIIDDATGLNWQKNDSGQGINWESALAYCEDLSLNGQTDWRLPNVKELQGLVDYSRSPDTTNSPALDPIFNSSQITNEAGQTDWPFYWSGTTHVNQRTASAGAYVAFGRALGYMQQLGGWVDVHGAGAQRSDPKTGNAGDYPTGHGPQGDAIRINNYARCVRGNANFTTNTTQDTSVEENISEPPPSEQPELPQNEQPPGGGNPPQEAIAACQNKNDGSSCSFIPPQGTVYGTCRTTPEGTLACVP